MTLREFLGDVASAYDVMGPMDSAGQVLLRSASEALRDVTPPGFLVIGSGGKGRPTFTPWVGFFDPDETHTPQDGIYVVYLFHATMSAVSVSLNQGITRLRTEVGLVQAREKLASDAALVRSHLTYDYADYEAKIDLGSGGARQSAYEAGNILAVTYSLPELPDEVTLRRDLAALTSLYGEAVATKREILQARPGAIASASTQRVTRSSDPRWHFKPKNPEDYMARLVGRELRKSRRHEAIVRDYGYFLQKRGFRVSTDVHPRDLVAARGVEEWLMEVKVLYRGNASDAVRAALGQLQAYRHFLYATRPPPELVAVMSEPIGDAYVDFLATLGVACVWHDTGSWRGSVAAHDFGLCDRA